MQCAYICNGLKVVEQFLKTFKNRLNVNFGKLKQNMALAAISEHFIPAHKQSICEISISCNRIGL